MRIGLVGAGGAGGYFAARWVEAGRDVVLIARGAHLERIRSDGLRLRSPLGDATVSVRASDDMAALGSADLVVFATKTWQLQAALDAAGPHVPPGAPVFGLQNGVEAPELMRRVRPPEDVLAGTCRLISYVEEPGVIRHVGVSPMLTFGETSAGVSDRARRIQRVLDVPDVVSATASDDALAELWTKFLFFAPLSGIGALTRCEIGRFRAVPETRRMLEAAVREVAEVGRAAGVALGPDAVARTLEYIDRLPPEGTTSMQRDFEAGRRTELEALSGFVSRRGSELGVPTPTHDLVRAALLPLELEARRTARQGPATRR